MPVNPASASAANGTTVPVKNNEKITAPIGTDQSTRSIYDPDRKMAALLGCSREKAGQVNRDLRNAPGGIITMKYWNKVMEKNGLRGFEFDSEDNFQAVVLGRKDGPAECLVTDLDRAINRMHNTQIAFNHQRDSGYSNRVDNFSDAFNQYVHNTHGFIYVSSADQIEAGKSVFGTLEQACIWIKTEYGNESSNHYDHKISAKMQEIQEDKNLTKDQKWAMLMSIFVIPRMIAKIQPGKDKDKTEVINEMLQELGKPGKRGKDALERYNNQLSLLKQYGTFDYGYVMRGGFWPHSINNGGMAAPDGVQQPPVVNTVTQSPKQEVPQEANK
ncbi:MAG: hypothetical protein WC632_02555 [Candidatus Margulisiibacteriota bacterium]